MLASAAAEHVESLKLSVSCTVYTMSFETGDADHAPERYFAIASANVGLPTSAFTGRRCLFDGTP